MVPYAALGSCDVWTDLSVPGTEGVSICKTACVPGFHPSKGELVCVDGFFSGASDYVCRVDFPCTAPRAINFAEPVTCVEGYNIPSSRPCTPSCMENYAPLAYSKNTVTGQMDPRPMLKKLTCQNGTLVDEYRTSFEGLREATYSCLRPCTAPEGIENAEDPSCSPKLIQTNGVCVPQCKAGFHPTFNGQPVTLECRDGVLSPTSFECTAEPKKVFDPVDTCAVETIHTNHMANEPCMGLGRRGHVLPGTICYTACMEGYTPNNDELTCQNGYFSPGTYRCEVIMGWWAVLTSMWLGLTLCVLACCIIAGIPLCCFTRCCEHLCDFGRDATRQIVVPEAMELEQAGEGWMQRHMHHHHHHGHAGEQAGLLVDAR